MPLYNLSYDYQNDEQSRRKRLRSGSTPIACIECNEIFFDNVSLCLHVVYRHQGDVSNPCQEGRDLASLRSSNPLSLTSSPHPPSSVGTKNEASMAFPRMNIPCPIPASSTIKSNSTLGDASLVHRPVLNTMPPLNIKVTTGRCYRSMMSRPYGLTSSSSSQLYSASGSMNFAHGLAAPPHLRLRNAMYGRTSNMRNTGTNQIEKPIPELIVISDDEVDDGKNEEEINLTLKL